ncbi:MAG TPA: amidase family protein [Candidatus Dormibacteraeota bacterium]|jgi:aspartyl-tRNA(Asn)/glutamyl-tRNA(Gln) amidotransferase subunit A
MVWLGDPDEAINGMPGGIEAGLFAGVPIVLKDLPAWQAGVPVGLGVRALEQAGVRAAADSPGGARLRAAGFITIGTTSTAPFGWGPWAANARGHTRTPYDSTRASNGSSGGSAASVAVGAVAVGTGADAAGSIRLPAAWCGVNGHKPG